MTTQKFNMCDVLNEKTYCMSFVFVGVRIRDCEFFEECDPYVYFEEKKGRCVWTVGNHRDFCLCPAAIISREQQNLLQKLEDI